MLVMLNTKESNSKIIPLNFSSFPIFCRYDPVLLDLTLFPPSNEDIGSGLTISTVVIYFSLIVVFFATPLGPLAPTRQLGLEGGEFYTN